MMQLKESRDPSGSESYDDFSANLRREMREVVHSVGGGSYVGHRPDPKKFPRATSPVVDSNVPWSRPHSHVIRAEPSEAIRAGPPRDDQTVQDRRAASRSSHLYHDFDGSQPSRHASQSSEDERGRGGDGCHNALERQLAMKDDAIVTLEGSVGDLEQQVAGKDAEIADLSHELHSEISELRSRLQVMKEAARDMITPSHARDLDHLETEYERAMTKADEECAALRKELNENREEILRLNGELDENREENHMLKGELDAMQDGLLKSEKEIAVLRKELDKTIGEDQEEIHMLKEDIDKLQDENQQEVHTLNGRIHHQTDEIERLTRQTHEQVEEILSLKRLHSEQTEDILTLKGRAQDFKDELEEIEHHAGLQTKEIDALKEVLEKRDDGILKLRHERELQQVSVTVCSTDCCLLCLAAYLHVYTTGLFRTIT